MKIRNLLVMAFAAVLSTCTVAPTVLCAAELIVEPVPTDPSHYSRIQAAIDFAYSAMTTSGTTTTVSYSIRVEPGTYTENLILRPDVSVRGRETSRTILNGGGGTIMTADSLPSQLSIQNFTFTNGALGISVSNNSSLNITNNIFSLGNNGTAIQVLASPATSITNNVFHRNSTAVSSNTDIVIMNNIFMLNGTAVTKTLPLAAFTKLSYNAFFSNTVDGFIGGTASNVTTDPLFVDTQNNDFHLLAGSPCISSGSRNYPNIFDTASSDMGAFGGPGSDTVPMLLTGVTSSTPSSASIVVSWNPNTSYLVKGYRVYYGKASRTYDGTDAAEGSSPINVASGTTSFTLSGLTTSVAVPAAPVLGQPEPLNQSLVLTWSAVTGATGYRVYFGTTSPPSTAVDVGNTTSYTLSGLTNGQTYYVAVSALAQAAYYVAVTAFDAAGEQQASTVIPGVEHESAYSAELVTTFGDVKESPLSNSIADFPEKVTPYPDLPDMGGGCFIATAAYGHYSAPQVQALRDFRDRYLLALDSGKAFVAWYYAEGPRFAALLEAHPGWKPVVRTALLPLVGMAVLLTRPPVASQVSMTVFLLLVLALYRSHRIRRSHPRGGRQ